MYALQAAVTHGNIAGCIAFAALNFHFFGGQVPSTHNFQPHFVSLLFSSLLNLKNSLIMAALLHSYFSYQNVYSWWTNQPTNRVSEVGLPTILLHWKFSRKNEFMVKNSVNRIKERIFPCKLFVIMNRKSMQWALLLSSKVTNQITDRRPTRRCVVFDW